MFHAGCCGNLSPLDTTLIVIVNVSGCCGIGKTNVSTMVVNREHFFDAFVSCTHLGLRGQGASSLLSDGGPGNRPAKTEDNITRHGPEFEATSQSGYPNKHPNMWLKACVLLPSEGWHPCRLPHCDGRGSEGTPSSFLMHRSGMRWEALNDIQRRVHMGF